MRPPSLIAQLYCRVGRREDALRELTTLQRKAPDDKYLMLLIGLCSAHGGQGPLD
jgi:hypothetical protein